MRRITLLLKLSLRNVFRNRRRSLFALATIAMGAMGLFVFMGFNRGIMNQYRDNTDPRALGTRTTLRRRLPWESPFAAMGIVD